MMNEQNNKPRISDEIIIEIVRSVKEVLIELIDQTFQSEIRKIEG